MRERAPATLDDALRIALQLEAWSREAQRNKQSDISSSRAKARGTVGDSEFSEQSLHARIDRLEADLTKRFDDFAAMTKSVLASQHQQQQSANAEVASVKPTGFQHSSAPRQGSSSDSAGETACQTAPPRAAWPHRQDGERRPFGVCWKCSLPGHHQRDCTQTTQTPASAQTQSKPEGAVNCGSKGKGSSSRIFAYATFQ